MSRPESPNSQKRESRNLDRAIKALVLSFDIFSAIHEHHEVIHDETTSILALFMCDIVKINISNTFIVAIHYNNRLWFLIWGS
ncbi:MAG: hypothetical protein HRU26_15680 [Psychroserpens sp.]|nr:hypothetical protein [Psychroserpens sp.]